MNTFGQGFKFGLVSGLYNNMFGGLGMPCFNNYMANPFCNYSFSPMFFTPTFSFNSFTPYHSMDTFNNFSYSQNLNPFSLWSSNSYYNNPTVSTPQNQFNYDYFGNLSSLNVNNEKTRTNAITSISTNTQETVSTTATTQTNQTKTKVETVTQKPVTTKKTRTEEKPSVKSKTKTKKDVKIDYSAENLKAKWEKKKPDLNLSDEFYQKVVQISKNINCDPNELMGIMNFETRGTFKPDVKNKKSGAIGLIQFMDDSASDLGTTRDALSKMTAEEQLDYVEKYFKMEIKRRKVKGQIDGVTLYTLVFYPAWAQKGLNETIASKGSNVYNDNPSLDANGDGRITKSDFSDKIKEFIA